jgi:L-alanine-DL-glutamate epimerase-like enolase superfamily enzyme
MDSKKIMTITDVKVIPLKKLETVGSIEPAWDKGGLMHFNKGGGSFTEVHTSEGIVGIGPGMDASLVPSVLEIVRGEDPFEIEKISQRLRYYVQTLPYRGTAGVDIAIWDIIGKTTGQPLYKLWGGSKNRMMPYASMVLLSHPEERAELAQSLSDSGWKAIKLRLHHETIQEDIRTVELVREAVGDSMDIMVDANQAQSFGKWQPGVVWDYRRAYETGKLLQDLNVYWLEEPLQRFSFKELAQLNHSLSLPVAGGENNRGIHEFRTMVEGDVYDVLQPESMVMDGVTELRKIGTLAELYGKKIVPHHGGGDIGVIAHLHLVASWQHAPYLELLNDPPIGSYKHKFEIFENPPEVHDGWIDLPNGPGLGVEIDSRFVG